MTYGVATSADLDLTALAKDKLGSRSPRAGELDHVASLLRDGEHVLTLGDALFRSLRQERRGLVALTDQRLICVESGSRRLQPLELPLPSITSMATGVPAGMGDAKRGDLTILADGTETQLTRVRPWERAAEIAELIRDANAGQSQPEPVAAPA
jgi:hypothetical protein